MDFHFFGPELPLVRHPFSVANTVLVSSGRQRAHLYRALIAVVFVEREKNHRKNSNWVPPRIVYPPLLFSVDSRKKSRITLISRSNYVPLKLFCSNFGKKRGVPNSSFYGSEKLHPRFCKAVARTIEGASPYERPKREKSGKPGSSQK